MSRALCERDGEDAVVNMISKGLLFLFERLSTRISIASPCYNHLLGRIVFKSSKDYFRSLTVEANVPTLSDRLNSRPNS